MGWWSDARHAAAHEFGRRHYRGIAAAIVARRLVVPVALVVVVAGMGWVTWTSYAWVVAHLSVLAPFAAALLAVLVLAAVWRRFGELVEIYLPVAHPAALTFVTVAVLAAVTADVVVWLV